MTTDHDDATAAFVHGHYVEHCLSHGQAVPEWAWLNLLAHGTTHELSHHSRAGRSGDQWHQARAFMADEILDHVARRQIPLTTFQTDVLVPLELDSIASRSRRPCAFPTSWPRTPRP
ncbi:MAG: hypothetical protein U5R31_08465 [Acidimicrobiia bacterium]|nr:hypothetical protein [Acidimicrobiia bacterium]